MSAFAALVEAGLAEANADLAALTTYRFGGPARYVVTAESEHDLAGLAAALERQPMPVLVVGKGSNLVVSDRGFDGVAVRLGTGLAWVRIDSDGSVVSGGATPLPRLARESVSAGRGGLEFYVGIPGAVGGAVHMNAGGHGSDTAAVLVAARVFDLATGIATWEEASTLGLGYRRSRLRPDEVVVEAVFTTTPAEPAEGERLMRQITRWRREHQPGGTLNAGSVFKNPPGDSAGRLIDAAGLKGLRVGGAEVSRKHANFFEAQPDATAQDVYDLVQEVRRRVAADTGIWLQTEVRFAGPFR